MVLRVWGGGSEVLMECIVIVCTSLLHRLAGWNRSFALEMIPRLLSI